jgi:hypothetical protein
MQEILLEDSLKIDRATEGLRRQSERRLTEHGHELKVVSIAQFLLASRVESNISTSYKEDLIFTLCKRSNYVGKKFKDFTREEYFLFLIPIEKRNPKTPCMAG